MSITVCSVRSLPNQNEPWKTTKTSLILGLASDRQTSRSVMIRTATAALGALAILAGVFLLIYAAVPAGYALIALGGALLVSALSLKQVQANLVNSTLKRQLDEERRMQEEMGGNISLSDQELAAVKAALHCEGEYELYSSQPTHRVFSLTNGLAPNLIFKTSENNREAKARFRSMMSAFEVIQEHKLQHLVLPHAKLLDIDGTTVIVEEKIEHLNADPYRPDKAYANDPRLDSAIKDLTTFILYSHYSDVKWDNNPVIETEGTGPYKIALLDCENMRSNLSGVHRLKQRVEERHGNIIVNAVQSFKENNPNELLQDECNRTEEEFMNKLRNYTYSRFTDRGLSLHSNES